MHIYNLPPFRDSCQKIFLDRQALKIRYNDLHNLIHPPNTKMNLISACQLELELLREVVARANGEITRDSYQRIKQAFHFFSESPERLELLASVTPELNSQEYLSCVDEVGAPVPAPPSILQDYLTAATRAPGFRAWLRHEICPADGAEYLLPARWLCHLSGLRHGTAHLVLSIPGQPARLLVQIRSMAKSASPGCYDLPVAGHVDGLQGYPAALRKESSEELGLDIDQLINLRILGSYVETNNETERGFFNTEYHQVYAGQLTHQQVSGLIPQPSEVAAIAVFPAWELERLRRAYPGVFAPSIQKTLDLFQNEIGNL